jgi:hypothetical protein
MHPHAIASCGRDMGKSPREILKKFPRGSFPREISKKILLRIFVQNLRKDFRGIRYQRTRTAGAHTILLIIILYHFIQKSFFWAAQTVPTPLPPWKIVRNLFGVFLRKFLEIPWEIFRHGKIPAGNF